MLKIEVQVREVYGKPTVYPVCDKAKTFADMIGTKTFSHRALQHIEQLGYMIVTVNPLLARRAA